MSENKTDIEKVDPKLELLMKLEQFIAALSKQPPSNELKATPDNKARFLPIDFVETKLDELFFGMWETVNFKWNVIANEVVGSLELKVFNPNANTWLTRTGAASIQIMVDAVPDDIKNNRQAKNRWALDPENKKSNALDMGFPKLKTECLKNAAISLGNAFGRNLNRQEKDNYSPMVTTKWNNQQKQKDNGAGE